MASRSPNDAESDLRKAAGKFADAMDAAREAGLSVTWPGRVQELRTLSISATGRVVDDGTQAVGLTPVPTPAVVVGGDGKSEPAKATAKDS